MCSSRVDYICELAALGGAPEHEGTAAHVPSSDELSREAQSGSQHFLQRLEVLRRRDTAEQDDGVGRVQAFGQASGVALQRAGVAPIARINRNSGDRA